jgi:hypothetical protein
MQTAGSHHPKEHRINALSLVVILTIMTVSAVAYATNAMTNNSADAGYQGQHMVDNAYFTISGVAFYVSQSAQFATAANPTWVANATWYANALVAGQWFLMLSLTVNTGASASTPYTLTAINSTGTGTPTITLYSFQFTTAANVTKGQTVTILYGVGSTTWTAPAALTFTVA